MSCPPPFLEKFPSITHYARLKDSASATTCFVLEKTKPCSPCSALRLLPHPLKVLEVQVKATDVHWHRYLHSSGKRLKIRIEYVDVCVGLRGVYKLLLSPLLHGSDYLFLFPEFEKGTANLHMRPRASLQKS